MNVTDSQFTEFAQFIYEQSGIVLGNDKKYLVVSRLGRILSAEGIADFGQLLEKLRRRDGWWTKVVIDAMTTNETSWFRDQYPFDYLVDTILPDITRPRARIWSAACSSGEEPYSIAIRIAEAREEGVKLPGHVEILASDISSKVLEVAEMGEYDDLSLSRGLDHRRLEKFFTPQANGRYRIRPEIRRVVRFFQQNLRHPYTQVGQCDVVFCRNVLIYFSEIDRAEIVRRIAKVLRPHGFLFLGASESLSGISNDFELIRCQPGVAYRLKSARV